MTQQRDLKRRVRERRAKTGESYMTALRHVRAELRASSRAPASAAPAPVDPASGAPAPGDPASGDPASGDPAPNPAGDPVSGGTEPTSGASPSGAIPVVELVDCSTIAENLGLTCRAMVMPALIERIDPTALLTQLRDVLRTTAGDPAFAVLRSTVLLGARPWVRHGDSPTTEIRATEENLRFAARVRAGVGGISNNGRILAFVVAGRRTSELVVFGLWQVPLEYDVRPPALIVTTPDQLPLNVRFNLESAL